MRQRSFGDFIEDVCDHLMSIVASKPTHRHQGSVEFQLNLTLIESFDLEEKKS
jgi:hypothetical protein